MVNLMVGRGASIAQVTRDLDIDEHVLSRCMPEFKQSEQHVFVGHETQKPDDAEVTPQTSLNGGQLENGGFCCFEGRAGSSSADPWFNEL